MPFLFTKRYGRCWSLILLLPLVTGIAGAQTVVHTDPAKYRHIEAVHQGAGSMDFGPLLGTDALDTNHGEPGWTRARRFGESVGRARRCPHGAVVGLTAVRGSRLFQTDSMAHLATFGCTGDAAEFLDYDAEPDGRDHQSSQADPVRCPHRYRFPSTDHRERKGKVDAVPLRYKRLYGT